MGHRAGLDRCGKFRPHRDSIPVPTNPYLVAIPTTLPGPILHLVFTYFYVFCDVAFKINSVDISLNAKLTFSMVMIEKKIQIILCSVVIT